MSSIDAYLDQACGRLSLNPAELEDIREEMRGHLEELEAGHRSAGASPEAAGERALASFGNPQRLRHCLDLVHRAEPVWMRRAKGMAVGAALGGLLSLLLAPAAQVVGFGLPVSSPATGAAPGFMLLNGLCLGGVIGLLSATGPGVFIGWVLGSLVWLAEYVVSWVAGTAGNALPGETALSAFNAVLLSPVLGGVFGAVVGLGSAAALALSSRLRPEIR